MEPGGDAPCDRHRAQRGNGAGIFKADRPPVRLVPLSVPATHAVREDVQAEWLHPDLADDDTRARGGHHETRDARTSPHPADGGDGRGIGDGNTKIHSGTQNGTASFPDQASLFIAGAVSSHVGIFSQFTYAAADGSFGIDNVDIRYANHTMMGESDLLYGVTLNNNPTVQDVWNTVPAWGFPFMSSGSAPSGNASTLIDGGLGQEVLGLGAYALWNGTLYTELTGYRSAPQGAAGPLDSTAVNTTHGVLPYWRVALQHQFDAGYLMVGTFGFAGSLYPNGVTGPTDRHTNLGFDAQFERPAGDGGAVIVRSSFITEHRQLTALLAADPEAAVNASNRVSTFRLNATYQPNSTYGFTAGLFGTGGTTDTLLYAPAPVTGSATGSPSTRGYLLEMSLNAWQNVRLAGQYVGYTRFNGGSSDYDGSGRSANNNGTFYLYTWIAY